MKLETMDNLGDYKINVTKFILQDNFPTTDAENRIRKMQILRVGTFSDPRYGKFSITKKMLGEMVENFKHGVRGVVPALDYKHEADDVAAGWFKDLYLVDDELWAEIEMTPRGEKVLSDKEFGYVSADFDTDYRDNESGATHGCVLLGAGLTNRPVVKRMESVIQLSEKDAVSKKISKLVGEGYPQDQAVAIALEMERKGKLAEGEEMKKEEMKPELKPELKEEMKPEEKVPSELEVKLGEYEKKMADMEKQCADMKKLADVAGEMSIDEIIELVKKAMEAKKPVEEMKPEVEKPEIEVELMDAKKQLAEVTSKLQLAEKTNKFQVMLSEGKAVEAQREAFIKGDMEAFAENAVAIKLSEVGHGGIPAKVEATPEEEVLKQAKVLSESKKIGMTEAISEVLNGNKQLAEKIR